MQTCLLVFLYKLIHWHTSLLTYSCIWWHTHIQCICSCIVLNLCVMWSTPSITRSCSIEAFLNQKNVSCHSVPLMMMYWSCSMVMLQPPSPASFGASQSMMQVCLRGQHQLTQGLDTRRHRANFKWKGNRVRSRARALVMQGTRCCIACFLLKYALFMCVITHVCRWSKWLGYTDAHAQAQRHHWSLQKYISTCAHAHMHPDTFAAIH